MKKVRVGVTTVYAPHVEGGAEILASGLVDALRAAGHMVHEIRMPFSYAPIAAVQHSISAWQSQNFSRYGGGQIDRFICLKFPTYYLSHPNKVVWLLHQHRPVYELFGTRYGMSEHDADALNLRADIRRADELHLRDARGVFTIAKTVSDRLQKFNGIASQALYHPPRGAESFYAAAAERYIFCPSRLETLKRQNLLLEAIACCRAPVFAVLAGEGGQCQQLKEQIERLGLVSRVRLLGAIGFDELCALYAHALAVFFGPFDEDYGYVTLEAMLSAKPVITCSDSGGPLEFIVPGVTGHVVPPEPEAIAQAIEHLMADAGRAADMGRNGRSHYETLGLSWQHVVQKLLDV